MQDDDKKGPGADPLDAIRRIVSEELGRPPLPPAQAIRRAADPAPAPARSAPPAPPAPPSSRPPSPRDEDDDDVLVLTPQMRRDRPEADEGPAAEGPADEAPAPGDSPLRLRASTTIAAEGAAPLRATADAAPAARGGGDEGAARLRATMAARDSDASDEDDADAASEAPLTLFAERDDDERVAQMSVAELRELVRDVLREELGGAMGERISANIRKLVQIEVRRATGR
ncbi:hypothetical protein [Oceanicella actignis]|uniref:hypothetical protein n=1 Tax=Oceanicella actignis TaxID=1189325 RepID=UPI0011E6DD82|nr:hypothetical protein [Oceanicella actignis]TYO91469.1 hypothetical protein LY05_00323 [Oceanicella actignis]